MAEGVLVHGTCGLSQKPKLDRSSSLPSLIPGHLHGGIPFPLPGPSGGDVQDGMEVADQDQNFPSLETFSQEFYSYPFLVVEPPPSDRVRWCVCVWWCGGGVGVVDGWIFEER